MKIRKMLGDVHSKECRDMMQLMDTQSVTTLASWAISYAKERYLPIYKSFYPDDMRFDETISACEAYLCGDMRLKELKECLRITTKLPREITENIIAQTAARAMATACSVIQTPTNALGFLFYGAAAIAYDTVGLSETKEVYDTLASKEFQYAYQDFQKVAIEHESNPVKLKWNC